MPVHPIDAALNHIIKSSSELIEWYAKKDDLNRHKSEILLESRHLNNLSGFLNNYLLYKNDFLNEYWNTTRKKYLLYASLIQVLHHNTSWEMLAISSNCNECLHQIKKEFEFIQKKYPKILDDYFESELYKNKIRG